MARKTESVPRPDTVSVTRRAMTALACAQAGFKPVALPALVSALAAKPEAQADESRRATVARPEELDRFGRLFSA